jgi:hypothetical protein
MMSLKYFGQRICQFNFKNNGSGKGKLARLAFGTEVGGAAAEDYSLDGRLAAGAGEFFAGVDLEKILGGAQAAVSVHVVSQSGAPGFDGAFEDGFDIESEDFNLGGSELVGGGEGVEVGGVEGFVDVDVAQAGDDGLVHEGVFDGAGGSGQIGGEIGGGHGEGFRAEVFVVEGITTEPKDAAEAAGVAKAEVGGR